MGDVLDRADRAAVAMFVHDAGVQGHVTVAVGIAGAAHL